MIKKYHQLSKARGILHCYAFAIILIMPVYTPLIYYDVFGLSNAGVCGVNPINTITTICAVYATIPILLQSPNTVVKIAQYFTSVDPWFSRTLTSLFPLVPASAPFITAFIIKPYRKKLSNPYISSICINNIQKCNWTLLSALSIYICSKAILVNEKVQSPWASKEVLLTWKIDPLRHHNIKGKLRQRAVDAIKVGYLEPSNKLNLCFQSNVVHPFQVSALLEQHLSILGYCYSINDFFSNPAAAEILKSLFACTVNLDAAERIKYDQKKIEELSKTYGKVFGINEKDAQDEWQAFKYHNKTIFTNLHGEIKLIQKQNKDREFVGVFAQPWTIVGVKNFKEEYSRWFNRRGI
uniref:Uncharacterized protein n=1 Tax=Romanomermis culicivorax TaxID=13658 RepID=A0A915HMR8_ROMCU